MRKLLIGAAALVVPLGALAAWFGSPFSAEMKAYNPQYRPWQTIGNVYVGEGRMRMERGQGNQQSISIFDRDQRQMYLLNPQQQAYIQTAVPAETGIPLLAVMPMPDDPASVCKTEKITCTKLGEEAVHGVLAEKWEIVDQRDPLATVRTLQWLDPKRQMLIKSQAPGKVALEYKFVGPAKLGEREVEKWELTQQQDQQTQQSVSYVDPELRVVIRQESGGQIMQLDNIKPGPQPDNLFQVPSNYRRVTMEEAQRSGQGGTRGMPGR
jgi:hypothetical protein